mgnify:CR=1 FL=1
MKDLIHPNRRQAMRLMAAATAATPLLYASSNVEAAEHTLKLASLAPPGSVWFKAIQSVARQVKEKTDGAIAFKIYGGGTMGDERAMVRKMRTGQLDGAVVTSVGLGDIDKQLLVLQLPLTFKSSAQLDKVRGAMSGTFDGILEKQGFARLGWGDVGFNYLFSNSPVATIADAKKLKMWVWDLDPVVKTVAKVAGINGVPMGVPDVLPSLQSGKVDAFLNSPYGAIALQWHTKATHVTNLKLAVTIGGTVVSTKGTWSKLSDGQKDIIRAASDEAHKGLLGKVRKANQAAIADLGSKHGIKAVEPKDFAAWQKIADAVRKEMTGSVFPKALVDTMRGHL